MKRVNNKTSKDSQNNFGRVTSNSLKTKNFNEMKTKNNVQKAILKSMAVVVSFVLISFTVSAQGFWESLLENNTFSEIAMAMAERSSETNQAWSDVGSTSDANAFVYLLEEETEEALELEDWMTNESIFTSSFTIEEEIESPMELENWMFESENFEVENINNETEIQKKYTTEKTIVVENIVDNELVLESWMVNDRVWGN